MTLPTVRTVEDIFTVIRYKHRWRRRQRITALKRCKRQLMILRMRGDVTPQEVARVNSKLIPLLNKERELLVKESLPEVAVAVEEANVEAPIQ